MPLNWNEIRARSARFADDWKDAHYEKGQSQTFYNEFFEVFGRRRRDVAVYEEKVKKLNNQQGFIDLFWPGQLLVEQKSAGRNLKNAREQATDYFLTLKERERPRYILLSDFQTFEMIDLENREEHRFRLSELPEKIKLFGFIAGYHQQQYKDQDPANIEAASLMSNLHLRLEESGYTGTDLERLLVRIMFCLFADDTAIFEPDSFLRYIEDKTSEDGGDLGSRLIHLFEILDTSPEKRQKTLDEDLAAFQYVNGQLFAGLIRTPSFDAPMRQALLQCCYFNWSKVSPALFGSLFQTVMLPEEQRKGGAHYTSERNILKTIQPLFMDELREEFERIRNSKSTQRKSQLEKFHAKLGTLTFLDPACGCGNFLILAYRELRLLEIEVLEALYPKGKASRVTDIAHLSQIDVDQFYGIEIEEFPARIAEAAMWLMDHQMNMRLSEAFGQSFVRLPLKKSAHITIGNALRLDWKTVVAPSKLSYMLGNPPFVGARYIKGSQKDDMNSAFGKLDGIGDLDYVTAWYWKAAQYIQRTRIKGAFVSTNSITQGMQVGVLWPAMQNKYGIHIHFAHRTFKWTIDEKKAKGMRIAAVYCVIVGFANYDAESHTLFDYERPTSEPHRIEAKNINPYLIDASNIVATSRAQPLCDIPILKNGNIPADGGNLILSEQERNEALQTDPEILPYIKKYVGGDSFINSYIRYCLWLIDCPPEVIRNSEFIKRRLEAVSKMRLESTKQETREKAKTPSLFTYISQPKSGGYLAIPRTSSENRSYIPIGFLPHTTIVSNDIQMVPNATMYHFGVLTSIMHMLWVSLTAGRLKSDYRYSAKQTYNTFPWPAAPKPEQVKAIEEKAQVVLDARAQFPNSTLADLYDPLTMPPQLLKAHQELDKAVDAAYRKQPFTSERERIEFLFVEYQRLTLPLVAIQQGKKGAVKKRKIF
jgi:type I restriction-modification system DNA methylase subunit